MLLDRVPEFIQKFCHHVMDLNRRYSLISNNTALMYIVECAFLDIKNHSFSLDFSTLPV